MEQGADLPCVSLDSAAPGEADQFIMGDDSTYAEEAPAHGVTVSGFWIDIHEVTNAQFARFVKETGYVTVAERKPSREPVIASAEADIPAAMEQPGTAGIGSTPRRSRPAPCSRWLKSFATSTA